MKAPFRLCGCFRRSGLSVLLLITLISIVSTFLLVCTFKGESVTDLDDVEHLKTNSTRNEHENSSYDKMVKLLSISNTGILNLTKNILPDSNGVSPFRVLFVCDIEIFNDDALPYSRWFIHLYKAMTKLPGVEASIWGPGFTEYNDEKTLAANINKRWGNTKYFDFAFNYTTRYTSTRTWSGPGVGSPPIAVLFKDCVMYEKLPSSEYSEIFPCVHEGANLYFHRSANNMGYYAYKGYGNLLWHLPPAVHKTLFKKDSDLPHEWRPIDVFIPGCNRGNNSLYNRLEKISSLEFTLGNVFISKQSKNLDDNDKKETVTMMEENDVEDQRSPYDKDEDECITDVEKDYKSYLFKLKRSKIVIVSAGVRGSDVRRYFEAAAAGALVIGDVPKEHEEEIRAFAKIIKPEDSKDDIVDMLKYWLKNGEEREKIARMGQKYVLSKYTVGNSAIEVVKAMQSYLCGQRGAFFGHKFEYEDHFLPMNSDCTD